jgi:hypothetical protein
MDQEHSIIFTENKIIFTTQHERIQIQNLQSDNISIC